MGINRNGFSIPIGLKIKFGVENYVVGLQFALHLIINR